MVPPTQAKTNLLTMAVVALFVVLLNFSRRISTFLDDTNRYFYQWEFADGVVLMLDVVVLAALAVAVAMLLRTLKWTWASRLYNHLFLLALVSGVFSLLPFKTNYPRWIQLGWLGAVGVIGFSLGCRRSRLVGFAKYVCLIFSPLVIILPYQVLTAGVWGAGREARPVYVSSNAAATPVFLFVFDEWSLPRSTDATGEFLPFFTNLRRLAAQSNNFRQARSPWHATDQSLPRFIFQTDRDYSVRNGQTFFEIGDELTPTTEIPSLFSIASEHGYHTAMVGFCLPYRRILGNQVEYCRSFALDAKGENLIESMAAAAIHNLEQLTDPLSQGLYSRLYPRLFSRHWERISHQTFEEAVWVIEHAPRNTLALFHWTLPHPPYVFNADGTYAGPFDPRRGRFSGPPDDYVRQLHYLDVLIGKLMDRLQAAGKFDDALIVVTTDHGWRADHKKDPDAVLHIPLIVKMPGQECPSLIHEPFVTNRLAPIIKRALAGDGDEEREEDNSAR